MTHKLHFSYFKTGTGFRAKCSCGTSLGSATGCNRAGLNYGQAAAWERYKKHCQKISESPVMHPDCDGLDGVTVAATQPVEETK
jgi:hypothetical protein